MKRSIGLTSLGLLLSTLACQDDTPSTTNSTETGSESGTAGDGDGDPGDGDGDGDGDPGDGDGDGDPGDGDGDGDGDGNSEPMMCGNGVIEGSEDCDDGNMIEDDGCPNSCTITCGDGLVQGSEDCDDGNINDSDNCSNACTLPVCGDGIVAGQENCDDANMVDDDGCPNSCVAVCGDGLVQVVEECDDGNLIQHDGCSNACSIEQIEELNNVTMGTCTVQIGCSNEGGTSGNPQQLVECYTAQVLPPSYFAVASFTYEIGGVVPAPDALEIVIYEWDGMNAPGVEIGAEAVPMQNLSVGQHTVFLQAPVLIDDPGRNFCVGLRGTDVMDGFRVMSTNELNVANTSWFSAPPCDIPNLVTLHSVVENRNWCFATTLFEVEH